MTFNPVDKFIKDIENSLIAFSDAVDIDLDIDETFYSYRDFEKIEMVRDDMDIAVGHLVDMKFQKLPLSSKMKSVLDELLYSVDQFNELFLEEYKEK